MSAKIEFRDTMIIVRPDSLTDVLGNETLVIGGPSRGGTSIIAYILLNIGYYLGDNLREDYHEDRDILDAIGRPSEMEKIIAGRNQQYARWGFKVPDAVHYIDWLAGALRNPVFMVVFRNPIATTKSILKRDPNFGGSAGLRQLATALEHGLHKMELGTQALRTSAPSILIDVDAARATPEWLVRELADLFGPKTAARQLEAIAHEIGSGSYKPAMAQPVE
jgi:hypothetical protein